MESRALSSCDGVEMAFGSSFGSNRLEPRAFGESAEGNAFFADSVSRDAKSARSKSADVMRLVVIRLVVIRFPFVVGADRWLAARGVREEASAKGEASRPAAVDFDFVAETFASRAPKPDLPISPATYEDGRLRFWLWLKSGPTRFLSSRGLSSPRSVSPRPPKAATPASPPPREPRRYNGVTGALSVTRRDKPKAPPDPADPIRPPRDENE
mmetsp:Transcript_4147/g.17601  ORF Transcript_4147/g.17601 Transcript_4147/m.17601 type:complete len:212 (-) Transcript_4147:804-1439(-)